MKPMELELKTEVVMFKYWDCGNPEHRHKTEDVALECIAKLEAKKARNTVARKWTNEEYAVVLAEHRAGARKCDLAKSLGLSQTRVGQILLNAELKEKSVASNDPFNMLSARTRNCLRSNNLYTVESVLAAMDYRIFNHLPGLGVMGKKEVLCWLQKVTMMFNKEKS